MEWKRRGWDGKSAFFRSLFSGGTEAAVVVTVDRVFLVPVGSKASFSRRSRASKADVPESFDRAKKYKKSSMKETYRKTKRQTPPMPVEWHMLEFVRALHIRWQDQQKSRWHWDQPDPVGRNRSCHDGVPVHVRAVLAVSRHSLRLHRPVPASVS
ncbi:hypothetical protein ABIC15_000720 [Exiguobacterium sp. PvP048]